MAVITWLNDLASEPIEQVGGKASSLGRLKAAGFNVPDAFVIPTGIARQLAADWDSDEAASVLAAFAQLTADGSDVAVRSSAVDEDSEGASFAGQHATILEVRGEDAFRKAVGECLTSLHSEAAAAYREKTGKSADEARMAIVVQRMVPAEVAGVAFSLDPLTGDTNRVVVEAVRGLGEGLVSGTVEADRMVLDRARLAVIESHRAGEPALTEAIAQEAAKAALRAEHEYGLPQDIEFAFAEGTLWMLQSRPVTTLTRPEAGGGWVSEFDTATSEADHWTSANVQEILPGLVTPLTITVFMETVPIGYTQDYQQLRMLAKDENTTFIGTFYSRVFLNITATRMVGDRALGGSGDAVEKRYLGGDPSAPSTMTHSRKVWKHRLLSAVPLARTMLTLQKQADRVERETGEWDQRIRRMDLAKLTNPEIERQRRALQYWSAVSSRVHLRVTGVAGFGFENVQKFVQPILGSETEGRLPTLFTGLDNVVSAEIGLDLWRLSQVAKREGVGGRLQEPGFVPTDPSLPTGWLEAYGQFMDRHGHRGLNEMEASVKTWRYEPKPVLGVVASYLDLDEEQAPPATFARQKAARLALEADLIDRVGWLRRPVFKLTLKYAQQWVALRERTKSMVVRGARLGDPITFEIQRRMLEAGAIDQSDDLFFLANDDLTAFLLGKTDRFQPAVQRRRREYERNRHVVLPERFHGRPVPEQPDLSHHSGDILTGTPVSPGVVTGRARVIFDPATDGPMEPGEILVAPVTDAGWTPLFALASGLVVDMGSALSHGSTVAREYGLPAVVNVRRGTRSIRTGDLITVNGTTGTVTITSGG